MRTTSHDLKRWGATVALVVVAMLVFSTTGAGAVPEGGDPYGSTSSTEPPQVDAACVVEQSSARVGATVSGSVVGVEVGAILEFFLGGTKLGEVAAESTTAEFSFPIPDTMPPGTYQLVVVGGTFNEICTNPDGGTDFNVLAAVAGSDTADDGDSAGPLASTGARVLALLLVGLALLAIGYALRRRFSRSPSLAER